MNKTGLINGLHSCLCYKLVYLLVYGVNYGINRVFFGFMAGGMLLNGIFFIIVTL